MLDIFPIASDLKQSLTGAYHKEHPTKLLINGESSKVFSRRWKTSFFL